MKDAWAIADAAARLVDDEFATVGIYGFRVKNTGFKVLQFLRVYFALQFTVHTAYSLGFRV